MQEILGQRYNDLAERQPNLPRNLKSFQVRNSKLITKFLSSCSKVDILTAITDIEESRHVVSALPTGCGKTLPQLMLSSLVSPGQSNISNCFQRSFLNDQLI